MNAIISSQTAHRGSKPTADQPATGRPQRLLLKTTEVCEVLGGIHPRSLRRLEQAGFIRSVQLLRHKLYAAKDVEVLVERLCTWNQTAI